MLTSYKAKGVSENINSDVENVTMTLDGKSKRVASTDTLTVNGSNLTGINIGLIEAKVFDLSLSKTITKVTITIIVSTIVAMMFSVKEIVMIMDVIMLQL